MSENPSSPVAEGPMDGGMEGLHESAVSLVSMDGDNPTDPGVSIVPHIGGSQLTLSFQGEVYVFDCVSPEKVRFSLSLSLSFSLPISPSYTIG